MKQTYCISYPSETGHVRWTNLVLPAFDSDRIRIAIVHANMQPIEDAVNGLVDCTVIDEDKAIILHQFSFWFRKGY